MVLVLGISIPISILEIIILFKSSKIEQFKQENSSLFFFDFSGSRAIIKYKPDSYDRCADKNKKEGINGKT